MNVGIVGSGALKFTVEQAVTVKGLIESLLSEPGTVLVSGASPGGGVDEWAEQVANTLHRKKIIHRPVDHTWLGGFRRRNLKIARDSEIVNVIVPRDYPVDYQGKRGVTCYHCIGTREPRHISSGGCWTARKAIEKGKEARWHIIP